MFLSVLGFRAWIQTRRYLPNNQSKMPKPRLFKYHSVFSICYRQVQKAFTWCILVLRCPVLPIFSSRLRAMVSARHLTFFLDLAPAPEHKHLLELHTDVPCSSSSQNNYYMGFVNWWLLLPAWHELSESICMAVTQKFPTRVLYSY